MQLRYSYLCAGLVAACGISVVLLMTRQDRARLPQEERVPTRKSANSGGMGLQSDSVVKDVGEHSSSPKNVATATNPTPDHEGQVEARREETAHRSESQNLDEVIRMLSSVEARLARIEASLEKDVFIGPPPSPADVRAAPARNWDALNELARMYAADKEMAFDAVRFLSYREVLQRFGAPTKITTDNSFHYQPSRMETGKALLVRVDFLNGFVRDLYADLRE